MSTVVAMVTLALISLCQLLGRKYRDRAQHCVVYSFSHFLGVTESCHQMPELTLSCYSLCFLLSIFSIMKLLLVAFTWFYWSHLHYFKSIHAKRKLRNDFTGTYFKTSKVTCYINLQYCVSTIFNNAFPLLLLTRFIIMNVIGLLILKSEYKPRLVR